MHYITDKNHTKSKRHEELEKLLDEAREKHMQISQAYYEGNASVEEVEAILKRLNEIHDEWRRALILLKNESK